MTPETTCEEYRPNPLRPLQHRADCTDFYYEPECTDRIAFRGPNVVIHAIEEASERAGRTCNAQFIYGIKLCLGEQSPLADDERTEQEWRALLSQLEICFDDEDEKWYPCAAILGRLRISHPVS